LIPITKKAWTQAELTKLGFARYKRKKHLVMARKVSEAEAPVTFRWQLETFTVGSDYVICYDPCQQKRPTLTDYDHWPVRIDLFVHAYRPWDEPGWTPTPPEQHLLSSGCKPFFKVESVWATKLSQPTQVQSIESTKPVLVPAGMWLLIGASGDPWYSDDTTFQARYDSE